MFFCYILTSFHEKYLNGTYIGFTDDPWIELDNIMEKLKEVQSSQKGDAHGN